MTPTPQPPPTKTLTAHCFCRAVHYTLTLPTAHLPLPVHLCHCSICRYTHGTPCIFHAPLPPNITPSFIPPSTPAALTSYKHSAHALSTRVFCSTCGAQVGDINLSLLPHESQPRWTVSSSLFTDHGSEYFRIDRHIFTDSAVGGLHTLLPRVGGRELEVFKGDYVPASAGRVLPPEPPEAEREVGRDREERMRAQCHCAGVSFTFPRPTSGVYEDDGGVLSKYVSPVDGRKWMATMDICGDCRLQNGTHVVGWTFIPLGLIEPVVDSRLVMGTAKVFESSEGVRRAFCGRCGATVFYWCVERGEVVDVATGLLRVPGRRKVRGEGCLRRSG
ncbi:hypothetical protein AJ79_03542 [Helicocarpus griseus UAMH5409]|uniref:CENP-V/GFA domain-containing protein n=1 Tax=Helicocarpus griseus UAMH5409 TaxID=1447875 RepID=A0A2B7XX86_9EURO|nr:hypothetical protein AJ79_03542 [Helicocarpus griseus UAMH5409]